MSFKSNAPIVIEDSTNVWFTSDTHFGHAKIIEYTGRPYANSDEMNQGLIDNFNDVLDDDSILFHMGDVTMNHKYLWAMRAIKGTHWLIPGNHDAIWPAHKLSKKAQVFGDYQLSFDSILPLHTELVLGGTHFLMSHMPYNADPHDHDKHDEYRPADQGLPLICGHVHGAWAEQGNQYNAGVDVRDFKPVPASELLEWAVNL